MAREKEAKVTVILPSELWKRIKIQAIRDDRDLKEVVADALERYLAAKEKKG